MRPLRAGEIDPRFVKVDPYRDRPPKGRDRGPGGFAQRGALAAPARSLPWGRCEHPGGGCAPGPEVREREDVRGPSCPSCEPDCRAWSPSWSPWPRSWPRPAPRASTPQRSPPTPASPGPHLPTSTTIARAGNGSTANAAAPAVLPDKSKSTQTRPLRHGPELITKLASDPDLLVEAHRWRRRRAEPPHRARRRHAGPAPDHPRTPSAAWPRSSPDSTPDAVQDPAPTASSTPRWPPPSCASPPSSTRPLAAAHQGRRPAAIAGLLSAATTSTPRCWAPSAACCRWSTPTGWEALAGDKSSLAILAVLFGVALRTDPSKFAQLANANNLDPNVNFVLNSSVAGSPRASPPSWSTSSTGSPRSWVPTSSGRWRPSSACSAARRWPRWSRRLPPTRW